MNNKQIWNPKIYDGKFDFISEYGKEVVELLNPLKGERILDLGCGSGDLTNEILQSGAIVLGIDLSQEMIEEAKIKYPTIHFLVGDAESLPIEGPFDAVFSNAALHWMKNNRKVVESVWNVLNNGGRFVAEFGGKDNIDIIVQTISEVLSEDYGIDIAKLNPWYFPSIAEYSTILEQQGFLVVYALHFDRLTQLQDGERGLKHWMASFASQFFNHLDDEQKNEAFQKVFRKARNDLFHDGHWQLDYKRLRIMAIKP